MFMTTTDEQDERAHAMAAKWGSASCTVSPQTGVATIVGLVDDVTEMEVWKVFPDGAAVAASTQYFLDKMQMQQAVHALIHEHEPPPKCRCGTTAQAPWGMCDGCYETYLDRRDP